MTDPYEQMFMTKLKDTSFVSVPATASSKGESGQMAYASGYLYICVAKNTWQRVVIATW